MEKKNQANICNVFVMAEKKCFTYSLSLLIQLPYHHFPTNYYLLIPISHYLENGRKNKKTLRKHGPFSQMLQFLMKDVVKDLKTLPEGDASETILIPFDTKHRAAWYRVSHFEFCLSPPPKGIDPPSPRKNIKLLGKSCCVPYCNTTYSKFLSFESLFHNTHVNHVVS